MDRRPPRTRSLAALLVGASLLPIVLALALFVLVHLGGEKRMRQELEQRAALIATALAEASEYGLISGNPAALDRSVRSLLDRDRAIAAIDVLDATRHPFVSLSGPAQKVDLVSVEIPVRSSVPDIDFFDQPTPHVSLPDNVQPTFRLGPVVGYVKVALSTAPFLDERLGALRDQVLLIFLAGLAAAVVAWFVASRYDGALESVLDGLGSLRQGRYDLTEGPRARGILGRVQQALLALAEELTAQGAGRGRNGAISGEDALHAGDSGPHGGSRAPSIRHDRVARRIAGRVDAALVALRLAAHSVARLSESSASDEDARRVNDAARRVLGASDQAGIAGVAAMEPLRDALVAELGLRHALQELVHACALAHADCSFDLEGDADLAGLEPAVAAAAHRAVQEVLVHLVAYSDAAHVVVRPSLDDGAHARIVVAHDGETEVSSTAEAHLAQVRDGIVSAGGRLETEAAPGLLTLVIPSTGRSGS
jgi:hypothetical protein